MKVDGGVKLNITIKYTILFEFLALQMRSIV